MGSQGITMITGLARSIIMARLLMPEDFGLVALALIIANLVWNTTALGIDSRLVQKDRLDAIGLSTHLGLRVAFSIIAFLILLAALPLFKVFYPDRPDLSGAVLAYGGLNVLRAFNQTPYVLLKRRLAFRRVAVVDVASSAVMLIVAPYLAWAGWGFWSLVVGEDVTGTLVSTAGYWFFRRPMRLSFRFHRVIARDFVSFGKFVMVSQQLRYVLDRFDDFWAGTALGEAALGYYSKAYEFAIYPRRMISAPLQDIFFSSYSRLQHDRLNLSRAFFRANGYVVRAGFLFSSFLFLVAPEFVQYVLGEKWLPMLSAFRLMIVYCLFDPLLLTAGNLLTACGAPQKVTRIRIVQIVVFIPSVIVGAALWQINGIAVAADVMLLVGLLGVFRMTRPYVNISTRKLFAAPLLALAAGGGFVAVISYLFGPQEHLLWALVKGIGFAIPYSGTLLLMEGREYRDILEQTLNLFGLSRLLHRSAG
jgi:O-antigen/teichoic acid export membrane protein